MAQTKTITIPVEEYNDLIKCRKYVINWGHPVVCRKCGNYNPSGYICAECGWDNFYDPDNDSFEGDEDNEIFG